MDQLSRLKLPLAVASAVVVAAVGGVWLLAAAMHAPPSILTRDPVDVLGGQPHVGLLSNIGVMLWAAAAAVCLLGASLAGTATRGFLLTFGLLSMLLGLDDALMLHERVLPRSLGIPQNVVMVGWVLLFGGVLVWFRRRILSTDWLPLALAYACLGASATMDQFLPFRDFETFVEDAFKFAGIVFWLTYLALTTRHLLRPRAAS